MKTGKQKFAALALSLMIGLGAAAPALAHDEHGKCAGKKTEMSEKKEEMKEDFFKQVNATPEQQKKIDALDTQYRAKIEPLEKQMWQKKQALMSYVVMPNSDKAQAIQQEAEVVSLKSQIGQLYIEQAYTQKSYLTPEQQKKASEFYEKKAEKMKNDHHDD